MDEGLGITLIALICELIILIPILVFFYICRWKIFVKAGQEGWHALIPYYGTYILTCKIAGKDDTTFILSVIPVVRIYGTIVTHLALAKSFGKDEGFGIGLVFLSIVFYPMLAFGKKNNYVGPGGIPVEKTSENSLTTNWQNPDKPSNV